MQRMFRDFTRREFIWATGLAIVQLGVLTGAATGCWNIGQQPNRPRVQLSQLQNPPQISNELDKQPVLKVAVASVISPMENVILYGDMLNLLGERVQMKVQMIQRPNYSETNRLIENGEVQLAFICSGALMDNAGGMEKQEILATPQIAGSTTYRSYIIVPSSSKANSLLDLKGKSFAYTDPLSFSGRIAPQYMIKSLGFSPEKFFSRTILTYSHDNSIRAVEEGIVEAAAVDSLIYDLTLARRPEMMSKIKVIDQSEAVGNPPVVVSTKTDEELKARLKNALLTLHTDERGRKAMGLVHIDRFIHPEPRLYEKVWAMASEVGSNWQR